MSSSVSLYRRWHPIAYAVPGVRRRRPREIMVVSTAYLAISGCPSGPSTSPPERERSLLSRRAGAHRYPAGVGRDSPSVNPGMRKVPIRSLRTLSSIHARRALGVMPGHDCAFCSWCRGRSAPRSGGPPGATFSRRGATGRCAKFQRCPRRRFCGATAP